SSHSEQLGRETVRATCRARLIVQIGGEPSRDRNGNRRAVTLTCADGPLVAATPEGSEMSEHFRRPHILDRSRAVLRLRRDPVELTTTATRRGNASRRTASR